MQPGLRRLTVSGKETWCGLSREDRASSYHVLLDPVPSYVMRDICASQRGCAHLKGVICMCPQLTCALLVDWRWAEVVWLDFWGMCNRQVVQYFVEYSKWLLVDGY